MIPPEGGAVNGGARRTRRQGDIFRGVAAPRTIHTRAWYFDDVVDLKKFRAANPHYKVLAQDPLVIELEHDRLAVIAKYGTVVFWNFGADSAKRLRDEVYAFIADRSFDDRLDDQVPIVVGAERDEVLPNEVRLAESDTKALLPRILVVCEAIAQSVALDHLEHVLAETLQKVVTHLETLRTKGRITFRTREITRTIGFAMTTKNEILGNLSLFDKPDTTWESPDLERLYRALHDDTFDLEDRVNALDRKLAFLQDGVETLLNIIQTRRTLWLEMAIVVLIVVEIVLALMGHM